MYVCSLRTNKWSYDHRQEGAALGQKMSYIRQTAGDRGALKDIQIFGMSSWLRQVHDAVLKLFRDFQLREQRVRLLGDLAEVALTFLRNGGPMATCWHWPWERGCPSRSFCCTSPRWGTSPPG